MPHRNPFTRPHSRSSCPRVLAAAFLATALAAPCVAQSGPPLEIPTSPPDVPLMELLPPDRLAADLELLEALTGEWTATTSRLDELTDTMLAGWGMERVERCCNGYWIAQSLNVRDGANEEDEFTMFSLTGYDAVAGRFVRIVVGGPFARPMRMHGRYDEPTRTLVFDAELDPLTANGEWRCVEKLVSAGCRTVDFRRSLAPQGGGPPTLSLLLERSGSPGACHPDSAR